MARLEYTPVGTGGPGIEPRWTHSAKDIIGTAYSTSSRIWFTVSRGVLSEIYFPTLDRDRTWFLNLDTVGSPTLILLEGEGPVVMEDYHDRSFRDLVARAGERAGTPVRRGMRSRNSTDAVVPSRAGYPIATITSMDRYKALSNYHKMSDTPDHVHYKTVVQALILTEAVARELAANPWLAS